MPQQIMPHRIRLHGPWLVRLVSVDSNVRLADPSVLSPEQASTLRIPEDWDAWGHQAQQLQSRVVLSRSFGKPTGLAETQEVWLVVEADWRAEIRLNDGLLAEPLAQSDNHHRFPLRSLLLARNRLQINVDLSDSAPSKLRPSCRAIYLEIDSDDLVSS